MNTNKPCNVCGHNDFVPLYQVTDTNQFVNGNWTIEQCTHCNLGRLQPFPTPQEVSSFYKDVFYDDSGNRFLPIIENLRLKLASFRGKHINNFFPSKGKLLDFGAGAGNFASAMKKDGWKVYSVDPYSKAATNSEMAKDIGGKIKITCEPQSFEVITLWYVIEHLWDPNEAIKEAYRILKPNGILVLAQQDFNSLQAKVFKANWLFLDPPRHLFQFSVQNLSTLAQKNGFSVEKITHNSFEMGPFTILQSLLNILIGNKNYLFRFLRSRKLNFQNQQIKKLNNIIFTLLSLGLSVILAPVSIVLYYILLIFNSGDVFTLYLRKTSIK